jgi:hypothetical protein
MRRQSPRRALTRTGRGSVRRRPSRGRKHVLGPPAERRAKTRQRASSRSSTHVVVGSPSAVQPTRPRRTSKTAWSPVRALPTDGGRARCCLVVALFDWHVRAIGWSGSSEKALRMRRRHPVNHEWRHISLGGDVLPVALPGRRGSLCLLNACHPDPFAPIPTRR